MLKRALQLYVGTQYRHVLSMRTVLKRPIAAVVNDIVVQVQHKLAAVKEYSMESNHRVVSKRPIPSN